MGAFQLAQGARVIGLHYRRTADAWVENLDRNREAVLGIPALERSGAVESAHGKRPRLAPPRVERAPQKRYASPATA